MSINHLIDVDTQPKYDIYVNNITAQGDVNLNGSVNNEKNKILSGLTYGAEKIIPQSENVANVSNVRVYCERKGLVKNYDNIIEYIEYRGNFTFEIINQNLQAYTFLLNVSDEGVEDGLDASSVVYDGRFYSRFPANTNTTITNLDFFLGNTPIVSGGNLELYYANSNNPLPNGDWNATFRVLIPVKAPL